MINRSDEREQVRLKASGGDEEERSEREMASSRVDPSDTDEEDMEENPAKLERKGRPEMEGKTDVEGSIVGSGRGGEPSHRNTMGHSEAGGREPKARHTLGDRDGTSEGEGFNAGGSLRKEHGKVRNEP